MSIEPIDIEAKVRAEALALVHCGIRPAVIRMLCGPTLSITEYQYLFKCFSKLPADRRHGRMRFNPKAGPQPRTKDLQLKRMPAEAANLLIEGIELANEALQLGANKADSVAAAWRMVVAARGAKEDALIAGVGGEDLATLWLNHQVGDCVITTCSCCGSRFLQLAHTAPTCLSCETSGSGRLKKAA